MICNSIINVTQQKSTARQFVTQQKSTARMQMALKVMWNDRIIEYS